ncbi:hypothetical protein [Chitinophaga qingshengii]|uniref:Tetratricopeptide repeat protein n=1 Tax=Chitinophaga qingshengii TaxID=1569794 RepID=A0ABR7TQ23_9BACT|nr:hypothetical protein [Chitinophaga qingshengii]MBC9932070.1 hypothetical protein [Chitinophaga qingshengii]
MSRTAVIRLVKTLSKSEKRQFRLYTRKHTGTKEYITLFDLIDKNDFTQREQLEEKFRQSHAGISLDNAARYLLRILTDCLIQSRVKEDDSFQLLYGLLRVNMLKERNLPEEGYRELKKLQQMADVIQDQFINYLFFRQELNHLAAFNFQGLTEKKLVEIQMKARNAIKDIRSTHEHYSLYELLKYRLQTTGKAVSEEEKRQLNDLVLSEMSIVNAKAGNNLESRKLHLLFQSSFFTNIGDYRSALKTFYQLNSLFEKNKVLWQHPPLDYLAALDGILDSLRTTGRYEEMPFYVARLGQLDDNTYPEYFRYMVRKSVMIYQLVLLMGTGEYNAAIAYIEDRDDSLLKAYSMADEEKQCELFFCAGRAYYHAGQYKKAQQFINEIVLIGKVSHQSVIYRAARLLSILVHYEGGNLAYLDYEIRSFKRAFQYASVRLKIESMLFKTIKATPAKNGPVRNRQLWEKIGPVLESAEKDKYEMQLRKYFDFGGWIKQQLTK